MSSSKQYINGSTRTADVILSDTEPTSPFPCMMWADLTLGVLKVRNLANSGWESIGSFDTTFYKPTVDLGFNSVQGIVGLKMGAWGDASFSITEDDNYVYITNHASKDLKISTVAGKNVVINAITGIVRATAGVLTAGGINYGDTTFADQMLTTGSAPTFAGFTFSNSGNFFRLLSNTYQLPFTLPNGLAIGWNYDGNGGEVTFLCNSTMGVLDATGGYSFYDWNGTTKTLLFRITSAGNLWCRGKLTQAGCLPKDYPLSKVWDYIESVQDKNERETQTEVDALERVVLAQREEIKQLREELTKITKFLKNKEKKRKC